MRIDFDSVKNDINIAKHNISFERIVECDWNLAKVEKDTRFNYGEERFIAFVPLEGRLYQVVFTVRNDLMRIISFRKANNKERARYDE